MTAKVQKWGNSLAVRLPKAMLHSFQLKAGTPITVRETSRGMLIVPIHTERPTLKELVEGITPKNRHALIDFGLPVGKEIW